MILNKLISQILLKFRIVWYKYFNSIYKLGDNSCDKEVIVSMTTIPSRIDTVWITIETIFRQKETPDRLILWLGKEHFNNVKLPKELVKQIDRGLEVRFCEDLICHTKYYYAMKENKSSVIITIDDDIIYPNYTVKKLLDSYKKNKYNISCFRAHKIEFFDDGRIKPYRYWKWEHDEKKPSHFLLQTGVSGVLYPPNSLHEELFNLENIKKLCPKADDIWLKFMALKKGTKVILVDGKSKHFKTVVGTQEIALNKYNVSQSGNDRQINNIVRTYNINIENFQ